MKTYPYHTPDGIIQLVEKRELDQLIIRLADARESHLHASARDVQTIQRQAIMLEKFAKALGRCTFRDWFASDDTGEVIVALDAGEVRSALSAYESANLEPVANPIDEAVKRMEAVPVSHLRNLHTNSRTISDGVEAVRARLIQAAKGEQP